MSATTTAAVAAVDLGASNGRVMVGRLGGGRVVLHEAHRFANTPVEVQGTLHWDVLALFAGVLNGLRAAGRLAPDLASVGIDTWAVDFGLLDGAGRLLGNPVHHRDRRTEGVMDRVLAKVDAGELYRTTGLQQLPFNTIYQLVAASEAGLLEHARTLLLMPDLLSYWLTGQIGAEATNASTTQLYDAHERTWAYPLIRELALPERIFPELREPGDAAGLLLPRVAEQTGLGQVPLTAAGSHDTASAVVAVPARDERFAYISCGTWSLVGLELDRPVLTEASRVANFTNEGGVDGTVRYLRNVMGLWLLQESMRTWDAVGERADLDELLTQAARVPAFTSVIDPDDAAFLPPGDMPARIAEVCRRGGEPVPAGQAELVRCILDSLALAHRRTVRQAQQLSGRDVDVVHIVGGGARNALLCQLTADACGVPVLAGPVEATAIGNVLIQGRAIGAVRGDLAELRELVRHSYPLERYEPDGDGAAWAAAELRAFARSNYDGGTGRG